MFAGTIYTNINPDWNDGCAQSLYQVFKKFQDLAKKYEHKKQEEITEEESDEIEEGMLEFMQDYHDVMSQCATAYEWDLLMRVGKLAYKEGRSDISSMMAMCRGHVQERVDIESE
jgi:hypothetical protein